MRRFLGPKIVSRGLFVLNEFALPGGVTSLSVLWFIPESHFPGVSSNPLLGGPHLEIVVWLMDDFI